MPTQPENAGGRSSLTPPFGGGRRRLRIVTLVDQLMLGGGELLAAQIAMALDPVRFESVICLSRPSDPDRVREVERSGIRVLQLDRRSKLDVGRWRLFVEFLHEERADVLHAHKHGSNVWAAAFGPLAGVPVIVAHEHNWAHKGESQSRAAAHDPSSPAPGDPGAHHRGVLGTFLDRHFVARSAAVVLGTSPGHWHHMVDVQGIDRAKTRYLFNASPPLGPGDGAVTRRELGIPETSPVIGTVCELRVEKAVEILIEAAAMLAESFPELKVLIAGDGSERPRLEALVERLGLADSVIFLGWRSRETLPGVLDALDVAVSSSSFEATPLSVIEFMAAGKPIVATRVGAVPALIEDGRDGILVAPMDSAGLAQAVAALLREPAYGRALGLHARERQRREFGFELMVRRLEDLYECLHWSSERGRRDAIGTQSSSRSRCFR